MYIYIYIHMYICIITFTCICCMNIYICHFACMNIYIYIFIFMYHIQFHIYISPPLTLEYLGRVGQEISQDHMKIPPHMFFGLQKKWGGVLRMPHFSPEMVWHTLSFSTYVHTYIHTCMHSTRPWRDHNYHIFLAEILLGVGGDTPTLFETFQFLPPQPSLPWTE